MKPLEIENWALIILESIRRLRPIEDSLVEVKAEWPTDPAKAARRIAGHANAAGGNPILWLIGIDETKGCVSGLKNEDVAEWWSVVRSKFAGQNPSMTNVNVKQGTDSFVALLFQTDQAPFVVKNPAFGSHPGPIEREVPWREGTAVRSATREDLIRILVPHARLPEAELLEGSIKCSAPRPRQQTTQFRWNAQLILYLMPVSEQMVVFPDHLCGASIQFADSEPFEKSRVSLRPPEIFRGFESGTQSLSRTLERGNDELLVHGPGKCIFSTWFDSDIPPSDDLEFIVVSAKLTPVRSAHSILVSAKLAHRKELKDGTVLWSLEQTDEP